MGQRPKRRSQIEQTAASQTDAINTALPVEESIDGLPLSFESPESSNISGASYDPSTQQLTVTFKPSRPGPGIPFKTYDFPGYEPEMWREFLEAPSKGHFFTTRIRPQYVGDLRQ